MKSTLHRLRSSNFHRLECIQQIRTDSYISGEINQDVFMNRITDNTFFPKVAANKKSVQSLEHQKILVAKFSPNGVFLGLGTREGFVYILTYCGNKNKSSECFFRSTKIVLDINMPDSPSVVELAWKEVLS